jgi:hypothetical protein
LAVTGKLFGEPATRRRRTQSARRQPQPIAVHSKINDSDLPATSRRPPPLDPYPTAQIHHNLQSTEDHNGQLSRRQQFL